MIFLITISVFSQYWEKTPIFIFQKNFQMKFLILVYWEKGDETFAMTYKSICRFLEKFHDATNEVTLHVGLGSCMNLFGKGKNFRLLKMTQINFGSRNQLHYCK